MFGHLKPEEFVNLSEGLPLQEERRGHLDQCVDCKSLLGSMESVRKDFGTFRSDILEPDWDDFRSSVRNELLSRSVQRTSALRRWTGWPIRPAMAWGLSFLLVVGVTTGTFIWHERSHSNTSTGALVNTIETINPEPLTIETEISVWSQSGVFEELSQLGSLEEENLRQILQSAEIDVLEQR